MFIGHFAVGFASKRIAPEAPLALLMAAPLLLDLLWPICLLTGLESVKIVPGITVVTPLDLHDYPYTHSLAMAIFWTLLFEAAYYLWTRDRRAEIVIGLGVLSHWILDFATHRPDMPLYPGSSTYVGLGLWNSFAGTVLVEASMFAIGVWLYATTTIPRRRTGSGALWSMVALLVVTYLAVIFGPPPPNPTVLAYAALASWLFVPWAWWIDRNREVVK